MLQVVVGAIFTLLGQRQTDSFMLSDRRRRRQIFDRSRRGKKDFFRSSFLRQRYFATKCGSLLARTDRLVDEEGENGFLLLLLQAAAPLIWIVSPTRLRSNNRVWKSFEVFSIALPYKVHQH